MASNYRRKLLGHEHQSWLNLRNTFLDVEAEAGMSRELRDKRLAQAEQAHAAQRRKVAERWNRQQMAREDDLEACWAPRSPLPCASRARRLLSELAVAEKGLSESAAKRASAGRNVNLTGKQSSSEFNMAHADVPPVKCQLNLARERVVMYPEPEKKREARAVPVTLTPCPLPASSFRAAEELAPDFHSLMDKVCCDLAWLREALAKTAAMDLICRKLLEVCEQAYNSETGKDSPGWCSVM
eukprot:s8131_g2.t1